MEVEAILNDISYKEFPDYYYVEFMKANGIAEPAELPEINLCAEIIADALILKSTVALFP
jgi:hypothetical protein